MPSTARPAAVVRPDHDRRRSLAAGPRIPVLRTARLVQPEEAGLRVHEAHRHADSSHIASKGCGPDAAQKALKAREGLLLVLLNQRRPQRP
jgi:hypothetical protein